MRLENGMRFDRCIGLQDRDGMDGRVFDADVLTCHHRPLSVGENIGVGGRAYRYDGDNSLGNSIFTPLEPFPDFESVEKPYKDLFIVLEWNSILRGTDTTTFCHTCRAARPRAHILGEPSDSQESTRTVRLPSKRALKPENKKSTNIAR